MDVAFSAFTVYLNVFKAVSWTGLNDSMIAVSRLLIRVFSTINASFGSSYEKLLGPVVQLPTKSTVLIDVTILFGLSENKIVSFATLFNSSVYAVALI